MAARRWGAKGMLVLPLVAAGFVLWSEAAGADEPAETGTLGEVEPVPSGDSDPRLEVETGAAGPEAEVQAAGPSQAEAGDPISYELTVANPAPFDAVTGPTVTADFPDQIDDVAWTCTAFGGATCPATGTGDITSLPITLPANSYVSFRATGTIDAAVPTGTVLTFAPSVSPGASATVQTTVTGIADVEATVTIGGSLVDGGAIDVTVVVTNDGPADAIGAKVTSLWPFEMAGSGGSPIGWTCVASGAGAACPGASGSGNLDYEPVTLPAGTSVTFTASGVVRSGVRTDTISAEARVYWDNPAGSVRVATASTSLTGDATVDVQLLGPPSISTNGTITYAILVTNTSLLQNAAESPTLTFTPAGVDPDSISWECFGGVCGSASGSGPLLDVPLAFSSDPLRTFESRLFLVEATVTQASGTLASSAEVEWTNPSGSSATSNTLSTTIDGGDVSITKASHPIVLAGEEVNYAILVSNHTGATVTPALSDTFPAGVDLAETRWSCFTLDVFAAGCTGGGPNTGNIVDEPLSLDDGAALAVLVAAPTELSLSTGTTLLNTASLDSGETSNTVDTDVTGFSFLSFVSKTATPTSIVAGDSVVWTLDVMNFFEDPIGAILVDLVPPGLDGVVVECEVVSGPGSCPTPSAIGFDGSALDLPGDSHIRITMTATTESDLPTVSSTSSNWAYMRGTNVVPFTISAGPEIHGLTTLVVRKEMPTTRVAGGRFSALVTVENTGPHAVVTGTLTDQIPAELTSASWTCVASGGATCPAGASGSLSTSVVMPGHSALHFRLDATVDPATRASSTVNTAQVTWINPASSQASAQGSSALTTVADLVVTKELTGGTLAPGSELTFRIVVTNRGLSWARDVVLTDDLPAGTRFVGLETPAGQDWTCTTPTVGANGTVVCTLVALPVTSSQLVLEVRLDDATSGATITNQVTVESATSDPDPASNSAGVTVDVPNPDVPTLPVTGSPLRPRLLVGLLFIAVGALLRRTSSTRARLSSSGP